MPRIDTLGKERHARHAGSVTNRPQVKDADPVGIAGELIFARYFGLDTAPIYGDKADPGYDFVTPDGRHVDVKATNFQAKDGKGFMRVGLFADEGQVSADLYVLVYVDDVAKEKGRILGWATKEELLAAPVQEANKPGTGYKIRGHRIHRSKLHPIDTLPMRSPRHVARGRGATGSATGLDNLRIPAVKEVLTIGDTPCTLFWNSTRTVAHIRLDQHTPPLGIVIYEARKQVGATLKASWYVYTSQPSVGYGRWQDAASAAVRIAEQTDSRIPAPTQIAPQPVGAQSGLDF